MSVSAASGTEVLQKPGSLLTELDKSREVQGLAELEGATRGAAYSGHGYEKQRDRT